MKPEILIKTKRVSLVEKEHHGLILVMDIKGNIIFQKGETQNQSFFTRSCIKPFQALPIIKSGTFEKFNFSLKELAVCCGSHAGSFEHIKQIKNILNKIGLNESYLKCGVHDPIDKETREFLIKNNQTASEIHNNCSGKHAGMLAVCVNNGWNVQDYLDFNHPLQIKIFSILKEYCNIKEAEKSLDGCSAPIWGFPLENLLTGYLKLFLENDILNQAFINNPLLIGGKKRIDSLIIEASCGKLTAKVGAEGFCVVLNLDKKQALLVKIMDADYKARSIVLIHILKKLKWLSNKEIESSLLLKYSDLIIKTHNGISVGNIELSF